MEDTERLEKAKVALKELYGDEKRLIVRNNTKGIVSIGFGKYGDEGGFAIQRSRLPIVLTDHFARDVWLQASDFRAAVSKGWLSLVSPEDYDVEITNKVQRENELRRLAAKAALQQVGVVDTQPDPFSGEGEPMVIDENTATMKPAYMDENVKQYMEYENIEIGQRPDPNTPKGETHVIGQNISSRALALIQGMKDNSLSPMEAFILFDADEKIYTADDLRYIVTHAALDGVKDQALKVLNDRTNETD